MLHDPSATGRAMAAAIERVVAVAAAHADAVDREGRFPAEAVAALRQEGLLGALVPVALGGSGATMAEIVGQCQRLGRVCASTAMVYAMHHSQLACLVMHALDDPWQRDFARRIATENLLIASITSEVGIGGDMRSSRCAVDVQDGRFTLEKQAPTVSYGDYADVFFVTARTHAEAPPSDQVLVVVPREDASFESTGGWDALGMRGTSTVGFTFRAEGVAAQIMAVPFADIAAEAMVPASHLMWGGVWTGIAVEALTRARTFLRTAARRQPGQTQPGAHRLMHAAGLLDGMQARLRTLIDQFDATYALGNDRAVADPQETGWPQGMARATVLNMLKHDVSTQAHEVVLEALRICGMAGYRNGTEFSIGRHLRDILSAQLMINNDRIASGTGAMLFAQRAELGTL